MEERLTEELGDGWAGRKILPNTHAAFSASGSSKCRMYCWKTNPDALLFALSQRKSQLRLLFYLLLRLIFFFFFLRVWLTVFKFIYLFIYYFWLCWVFVSVRGLSLVAASGGHSSLRCAGLSLLRPPVVEHKLQTRRLSSCGSRAHLLRGMWDLPRPGLEPVSPALAGRFSTTAPPGKPSGWFFNTKLPSCPV